MRAPWRVLSLAVATAPMACSALVGDYEVVAETPTGISTAHLCDIERQVFAFEIDLASTAQQSDLNTYYEIANPELAAHLAALAQAYADGAPGVGVTYVMGAAGVGKSFTLRNLDVFADTDKCEIQLAQLFGDDAQLLDFAVIQTPDLATVDGQLTFNQLPAMVDPTTFDLNSFLAAAGCDDTGTLLPVIIVDGLDEIHSTSSATILGAIDQFILSGATGAGPFIHFIAAGMPEAFNGWLTDPSRTEENEAILDRFTIAPPRYQTAGDLDFRVNGYLDFTGQLAGLEASGQLDEYISSVTNAVASNPFLTYSMGNLAVGNVAIERTRPGVNETEEPLKVGLFDAIVERAAQTHGRPDAGSALSGPYFHLLEEIAVRYIDVGDDGLFEVLSEDTLEVRDDDGAALGEVRVRDVLDRAGVALLTSAFASGTRYHFTPFWLHAHLVERYNQRTIAGYAYHTCE